VKRDVGRVRRALQHLMTAKAGSASALDDAIDLPLRFSFDYVNAGTNYALMGNSCVGAQCADEFFEHHPAPYYGPTGLLEATRA
jgi:hypothetical protein